VGEDSRLVNRGIPWGQGPKLGSSDNRPSERGLHSNHFLKRLILVSGVGRCWPGFSIACDGGGSRLLSTNEPIGLNKILEK
jgi:hypothetical protein